MAEGKCPMSHHGVTQGRGCSHASQGSFGKLFPNLNPQYFSDEALEALGKPNGLMHERGKGSDSPIPAAYTFFAQFVDHDVTLDVSSQLNSTRVQEPKEILNLRTMTLDLDCVYGFGPEASPFLYEDEKLVVGNPKNPNDLRRVIRTDDTGKIVEVGRALIGDPRNDENIFVSQLQFAFHLFHNKLLEEGCGFEEAQTQARYHYQYVVLHDFLRRVCDEKVYRFAMERIHAGDFPLVFGADGGHLTMPIEFSVAAYRFGHSLVRDRYKPNSKTASVELFKEMSNGFEFVPPKLTVQWEFLFKTGALAKSRKVDELLADELIELPDNVVNDPNPLNKSLAFRNLVRGRSLGLPSGRDVAQSLCELGYPVDPDVDLSLSKIKGWTSLSKSVKEELTENQPLFFYLLRESNVCNRGQRLGPTASAILMEVFGGMLVLCGDSFIGKGWSPNDGIAGFDHTLQLDDILKYVDVFDAPKPARKKSTRKR